MSHRHAGYQRVIAIGTVDLGACEPIPEVEASDGNRIVLGAAKVARANLDLARPWPMIRAMTDMSFTMPPDLKTWIDAQVALGHYADAGEYLRDLVRRDLETADEDTRWLRGLIAEGIASGTIDKAPNVVIEEIIAERRARRG